MIAGIALLSLRLFQMQILQQKIYEEKSSENSVKSVEIPPERGLIFDRNGKLIASNSPAFTLYIIPADYIAKNDSIIEAAIDEKFGYISKILKRNKSYSKFIPVKIKKDIDFPVISWLEENSEYLPGVSYGVEMHRVYPAGIMPSHVLGYTKEVSAEILEKNKQVYKAGDNIGFTGLEKQYEYFLKGEKGVKHLIVNSRGQKISNFNSGKSDISPIRGSDLILGLDVDVQQTLEQSFIGKRGAAVAVDPSSGEILALVSAPEFDLNIFSFVTESNDFSKLINDKAKPLFNRATMGLKPSGSTIKPLEALAALDMNKITENTIYNCTGGFLYGRFFKDHGGAHGRINVVHAIEKSCNSYFYSLIYKIGIDNWAGYLRKFGFGSKTGIDIPDENDGLVPDSKYYEKKIGKNWPRSLMASLGIGQGELLVTPVQLAQYTALIANYGKTVQPHLLKAYVDNRTGKTIYPNYKSFKVDIDRKYFDIVRHGMYLVVNGEGTARSIKSNEYVIAGKTGTAQNPHGEDHALFIGFAPFDNPKIAIAVVVENAGFGSTYAAPIAKKAIVTYLNKINKNVFLPDSTKKINNNIAGIPIAR